MYEIKYGEYGEIHCVSVPVKPAEISFCHEFARNVIDSNKEQYRKRGQTNLEVITRQIAVGKICEVAVCRYGVLAGFTVSRPDFKIYKSTDKSWDTDLKFEKDGKRDLVHCKGATLESKERFSLSWIIQAGGSGFGHVDKEIFHAKSGYLAICCPSETSEHEVDVFGFVSVLSLHEHHLLQQSMKQELKNTKRAVYFDNIRVVEHNDNLDLRWTFARPIQREGVSPSEVSV